MTTWSAQQYQLRQISPPNYDVTDPSGTVINPINLDGQLVDLNGMVATNPVDHTPLIRGQGMIAHWMDGELAQAWFADARAKLSNGDIIGALQSMMWAYNALNITWYSHPDARKLWRKYMAGPPQIRGSNRALAEFGQFNYNDGWFSPTKANSAYPGWGCAPGGQCVPAYSQPAPGLNTLGSGLITDQTFALAQQVPEFGRIARSSGSGANYVELFPRLWPFIDVPKTATDANGNPIYQQDQTTGATLNDPTMSPDIQNTSIPDGFIDESQGNPDDNYVQAHGAFRSVDAPAGPDITGSTPDHNKMFMYSNTHIGGYKVIGTPYVYYFAWLDEWISAAQSKSPEAIVAEARSFTTYWNNRCAAFYGGARAFLQQIVNLPSIEHIEESTGGVQNGLRAAAAATAAVGGALAAFTFGISAVIGGAASLVLNTAAATVRVGANIPRDEFGRFKPVLERGWLSGNPGDQANGIPALTLLAPDGFVRRGGPGVAQPTIAGDGRVNFGSLAWLQSQLPVVGGQPSGGGGGPSGGPPVTTQPTQPSSFGRTLLWLGIGGAAAYVGYKVLSGRKSQ